MTMRRWGWVAGVVLGATVAGAAGIAAAQRVWIVPLKSARQAPAQRASSAIVGSPQATIAGGANGIYCANPAENAVGVHDLGAIPAGVQVVVTVESYTEAFDPVAAVVVPTIGQKAADTAKVVTFYDNDSGGEKDARIQFVTPQTGSYVLLVGDYTDAVAGCYRYQALIE